jgi:transcriptional antiterminator NusG
MADVDEAQQASTVDTIDEATPEEAATMVEAPSKEEAVLDVDATAEEAAGTAVDEPTEEDKQIEEDVVEVAEEVEAAEEVEDAEDDSADDEMVEKELPVEEPPLSPYDLPGSWFVIHSYSGYENKVKANLETRIRSMHLEDKVFDVVIAMEDVVEYKGGKKVTVQRKKFPGYVLVRMYLEDDTWYAVRNTPSVTGFVGSSTQPSPLSRTEVERILGVEKEDGTKKEKPTFKPAWEVGETIRVVEGPFADFNGVIEDINVDQSKVRVLVDIFGRETPVELNFDQIVKY